MTKQEYIVREIQDRLATVISDRDEVHGLLQEYVDDLDYAAVGDTGFALYRVDVCVNFYETVIDSLLCGGPGEAVNKCIEWIVRHANPQGIYSKMERDHAMHICYGVKSLIEGVMCGEIDID